MPEFSDDEKKFLTANSILHVKFVGDIPVGIRFFMYTYGLVTGYQPRLSGEAHVHRFCYPKKDFTIHDVADYINEWNLEGLPRDGWVKYKGVLGEFTPDEKHDLLRLI